MATIYPMTNLVRDPATVKAAAQKDIVHITERGAGAYVFCSEEVFARRLEGAAEQALFEREMAEAIEEGLSDYSANRIYAGVDSLRRAVEEQRDGRA